MGKVKEKLIEDMIKYPEYYNGWVDYEFRMQCRKERIDSKPHKLERKKK